MKRNKLRIMTEAAKGVFYAAPVSAIVTVLAYLVLSLLPPALISITAALLNGIASGDIYAARSAGVLFLIVYFLRYLFEFTYSITMNAGVYEKATMHFRIRLYEKMSKLSFLSFENGKIMNIKNRAESAVSSEALSSIFNRNLLLIKNGIIMIGVAAVLYNYSSWLLLLSFLSMIPYFIIRRIRGKEFYKVRCFQVGKRIRMDYLWELLKRREIVKEMRVLGFTSYVTEKWKTVRKEVNEELWELERKENLSLFLCDMIRVLGYGLCVLLALLLMQSNSITIGVFGACLTAFLDLQASMREFLAELGNLPSSYAIAEDYLYFMDLEEEKRGTQTPSNSDNGITLKDVSFSYPNAELPALEKVSFTIDAGMSVAIVGENGSGKTTLSRLLLGMYPSQFGTVLYDNISVSCLDTDAFRLSAVAQDFVQYQISVGENITISRAGDMSDLEKYIDRYGFGELVESIGGLDKQLGKEFDGRDLSKGQWQQLAIARGMYRKGSLMVLDEPTAALDPIMESEILSKFIEKTKNQTTVIVSHRIGLCTKVDKIVVMDHGHITEVGNHNDLMKKHGKYYEMYTTQQKWYVS